MTGVINLLVSGGSEGTGVYSASVSTTSLSGNLYGPPGTAVTSGAVLCTPANGVSPYLYLWEFVSGSSLVAPSMQTSSSTFFQSYFGSPSGGLRTAVYRCKVTDNLSNIVYSPNVTITLEAGSL